jgi:hypothetical protein
MRARADPMPEQAIQLLVYLGSRSIGAPRRRRQDESNWPIRQALTAIRVGGVFIRRRGSYDEVPAKQNE